MLRSLIRLISKILFCHSEHNIAQLVSSIDLCRLQLCGTCLCNKAQKEGDLCSHILFSRINSKAYNKGHLFAMFLAIFHTTSVGHSQAHLHIHLYVSNYLWTWKVPVRWCRTTLSFLKTALQNWSNLKAVASKQLHFKSI